MSENYQYRKVWREGLEVAMKVKGSQGKPQIEWLKQEHPFTAISPKSDVHANHNEAQNSSLRRRASGYRRKQNLYAKAVEGLQRVLNMQRMIHNWVRPHWGLGKKETLPWLWAISIDNFDFDRFFIGFSGETQIVCLR